MKRFLSLSLMFLLMQTALSFVFLPDSVSAQKAGIIAKQQETLNNESIVEMINKELSEAIIISKIKSSRASFDTSASALQSLKKVGVSDAVIMAMVQKASGMEVTAAAGSTGSTSANTESSGPAMSVAIPDGTELKI